MSDKIILSYGEVLWDLLPSGDVLGGAPFNFAYRIHSLNHQSFMISRVGRDSYGERINEKFLQLGMDRRFLQWDDSYPTGTVQIQLDANQQPDYFIVPHVAYDRIEGSEEILEWARKADCICFGTLAQRTPPARQTIRHILENAPQALKLLDINLRKACYTPEIILESLQKADVLKLNETEALYLGELFSLPRDLSEFCQVLTKQYALSHCIVTLGERGVLAYSSSGETVYVPGYSIRLVDPCGSGDAFTAGFVDRYFHGKSLIECCQFGNALGALVATQSGATAPISREEIHALLESPHSLTEDRSLQKFRKIP